MGNVGCLWVLMGFLGVGRRKWVLMEIDGRFYLLVV